MVLIYSARFLEFFDHFPCCMPPLHIAFEFPIHDIRHTFSKFCDRTRTDSVDIDTSFVIELIDEREHIPEQIADFEFEFIVIFFVQACFDLSYLIFRAFDVVLSRRFCKPTVILTVLLLEPEKSGESVHKGSIPEKGRLQSLESAYTTRALSISNNCAISSEVSCSCKPWVRRNNILIATSREKTPSKQSIFTTCSPFIQTISQIVETFSSGFILPFIQRKVALIKSFTFSGKMFNDFCHDKRCGTGGKTGTAGGSSNSRRNVITSGQSTYGISLLNL